MSFVYPYFLFALSAIAVPIIIHLFNFRKYKRVYFSDVTFLKEVKLQTQSINRLKHLLILLCRILAVLFLVLAFAQPYLPLNENKIKAGEKNISIFIDNSFSMEALNTNGNLLEQSIKNAKEIVMAFSPSDKFQLLTQDFEARHQRLVNRDAFIELLNEIKISAASNSFKDISARQLDAIKNAKGEKNIFVLSDFQKESYKFNELKNDTTANFYLARIEANQPANVYIDSIWFSNPYRQANAPEELNVRICNLSTSDLENIPLKLTINQQQKAISSVNIEAQKCVETKLNYVSNDNGIQNGSIEITDYPITYDDKFYFSYKVISKINVLSIDGEAASNPLSMLYKNDSLFNFYSFSEKNIDYSSFKNVDLILINNLKSISSGLNQELTKFVANKGSLVVFPGTDCDVLSYNTLLQNTSKLKITALDTTDRKVDYLDFKHPLFESVFEKNPEKIDLPKVANYYSTSLASNSACEKIMRFSNNEVFFSLSNFQKGKIYFSAVPLNEEYSNFSKHALFVPLLYKIALNSVPQQELYQLINKNNSIKISDFNSKNDNVFHIANANNSFDIIPETRINNIEANLFTHNQIKEAGHYFVKSANETIQGIAFNYNRTESKFEFWNDTEIEEEIEKNNLSNFKIVKSTEKNLATVISEINAGIKLWKYCLLLALLFIAAEIILIRFWKS
ncbi:MAG: BatA domain-containing protein [Bacteroidota bacterium]